MDKVYCAYCGSLVPVPDVPFHGHGLTVDITPDCDYCGEDGHGEDECPVLRKERRQAEADYEGPLRGE